MKKKNRIWFYPLILIGFVLIITNSCKIGETINDIDGNAYHSVTIGTQVWLTENLKTTKYKNGDVIGTTATSSLDISGENTPKYQWPCADNDSNVATYGRLYTWYAITDSRGVCPTGWHVSSDSEWITMTIFLGGESVVTGKLKETSFKHWSDDLTTNESGFSAIPGSFRDPNGTFYIVGFRGYWWSASEHDTLNAWFRLITNQENDFNRSYLSKSAGMSVRCLRDK